jgi:hypothetical protein
VYDPSIGEENIWYIFSLHDSKVKLGIVVINFFSSCSDTWRSPTKRFSRWIVVCFMCAHESSYVYSHVCSKAPCFDDNLVL